jgi:hypothetical protein
MSEPIKDDLIGYAPIPSTPPYFENNIQTGRKQGNNTTKNTKRSKSPKEDSEENKDTREYSFYKYSRDIPLAESILVNDLPMYLQIRDGEPILYERIELDNLTIVPPDRPSYLSKEYSFSSADEIKKYVSRAQKETMDGLFAKVKKVWRKYFDIDDEALTLCSADTIFTYFQDRLGTTHYLLFVGDNNTGKSNALRIFKHLGYRPLFDVSITPANIYNFLNRFEEGQGIILEDEIDSIEDQEEKMRIYKVGYVTGSHVTRIYDSNGAKARGQQRFNTFCFKAFSSERQPAFYKSKGFVDRLFTIKCSPGNPQHDISEVSSDAGDPGSKKLLREIEDLRKLLLIYRMIHYEDQIPDVRLSVNGRDRQLCKSVIRLFINTKALNEIVASLSGFLADKKNKKLSSFDSYLYSVIAGSEHRNGEGATYSISNESLWEKICSLPGDLIPNKPQSYQTDEFGTVSKTQVSRICEDKFGGIRGHDGKERTLTFNRDSISRLEGNYSQVECIKILDSDNVANTFNTFNTFWNSREINDTVKNRTKGKSSTTLADQNQKNAMDT